MIYINQVLLIGRIVRNPEIRKTENDKKVTNITLAINRPFKDQSGEYQTDYIDCVLWEILAEKAVEFCKKGDLIGIKGRLQIIKEGEGEIKFNILQVIAQNLTMLSHPNTKKEDENKQL